MYSALLDPARGTDFHVVRAPQPHESSLGPLVALLSLLSRAMGAVVRHVSPKSKVVAVVPKHEAAREAIWAHTKVVLAASGTAQVAELGSS